MRNTLLSFLAVYIFSAGSENWVGKGNDLVIANGQMPAIAKDNKNSLHVVFGTGDSIMYTYSTDNGNIFSKPDLIVKLPHVYTFATRGPQIAATRKGVVVTACTSFGNIYSFYKENGGNWVEGKKVNDVDTIAKEGLMGLSADGDNAFAVWLDLRENKRNKIYGARSVDGGKTWSKNVMVYTSPDTTVCECCKPSVVVKGSNVYVMFRNWLQGSRDLYLIQSTDGGKSFRQAQKLGDGNWKLNGCPMDGGGLAVNNEGEVQTVWRRQDKIYFDNPGNPEKEIGEGRGCTMETVNNRNVFAWTESGQVVVITANGEKRLIGNGSQPVLKAIDDKHLLCVWENNKQIHALVLEL